MRKIATWLATFVALLTAFSAAANTWDATAAKARGQVVYWHAWAGDRNVNAYISWTAREVKRRYGVDLRHVKLASTSDTVSLLIAEKAAGRANGGRVDLIWLNGENFALLRARDLLFGPFAEALPNYRFVDTIQKPSTVTDFTLPTAGYESPWGMAQIVFFAVPGVSPPRGAEDFRTWAAAHPGRFTYPAPPDFTGTTFLKQLLLSFGNDPLLYQAVTDDAFARITLPLWRFLDSLHPNLWRGGKVFPANYPALRQLMNDGEIDIAFSFNPADAANGTAQKLLPPGTRPFAFAGGTIGNTHFVAIPRSAAAKEGAMVVANFLLSPEAQARKADVATWGDPTVLDFARLGPEDRARFAAIETNPAMPTAEMLGRVLPEPHPSWSGRLEQEWRRRYGQ